MPTNLPRISITVSPLLAAQLRRLSELTGNSQSALIGELLEGSDAVFTRLIRVLEAAKEVRSSVRQQLVQDLENAQGRIEQQLGLALDMVDHVAPLLKDLEQVKRRRVAGAMRGSAALAPPPLSPPVMTELTPLSNRGVRSNGKTGKNSMLTRT